MIGPPPLVPSWYKIPMRVETPEFVLVPLRMDRFHLDFEAYMSSIEHLQKTFDLDGSSLEIGGQRWPANSDAQFAIVDAAWCQFEWQHLRTSLTYTALDRTERQQLACGYIFRSYKVGYHVECQTWVRADRVASGFDQVFYRWFRHWVDEAWPFASLNVAWPGREIPWDTWKQIPSQVWSAESLS
jgi:hypothetical protein